MTERSLVSLVLGIAPVRASPQAERDRFVLLTLAALAEHEGDGEGVAISIPNLGLRTQFRLDRVREGLRSLEQQEILDTQILGPAAKRYYRLRRDTLQVMQWNHQVWQAQALFLLESYGMGARARNGLLRTHVDTVPDAVALVRRWRELPHDEQPPFHQWLSAPHVGGKAAQEILDAVDAWAADQPD